MGAWGLSGEAQRSPIGLPYSHSVGAPIRPLTASSNSSSLPGPAHPTGRAAPPAQAQRSLRPSPSSQWVLGLVWVWEPPLSSETLAPHIACTVVGTQWQEVRLAPRAGHPGTWSVPHGSGSRTGACSPP